MSKHVFTLLSAALLVPGIAGAAAAPASTNAPAASSNAPAASTAIAKVDDLFGNPVIVKAKTFEIKRSDFDNEVIRAKSQIAARGQQLPPEQSAMLERQILDQLIQIQLLQSKATAADKAAGKAAAEKRFAEAKAKLGSEDALNRQLKMMGATQDEVIAKWAEALTAEAVLKRELQVNITDADAKKYYDENPSRFEQPETVHVSHILLSTKDAQGADLSDAQKAEKRKQIDALLKRARAGEDFGKMAKENSEDPGSKDKGGEYTFPRGQMVPEFESAAFSLKTNQVSDVVTTTYGYHIIKLIDKSPAHKVEYSKAAPDIKEGLSQQALQKQFPDYLAKIKKEADVQVLDDKLKPIDAGAASTGTALPPPPATKQSK